MALPQWLRTLQFVSALRRSRCVRRGKQRTKVSWRTLSLEPLEDRTVPSVFTVTNTGDDPSARVGFVVIAGSYYADSIMRQLEEDRMRTFVIGEVREGEPGVEFVA